MIQKAIIFATILAASAIAGISSIVNHDPVRMICSVLIFMCFILLQIFFLLKEKKG